MFVSGQESRRTGGGVQGNPFPLRFADSPKSSPNALSLVGANRPTAGNVRPGAALEYNHPHRTNLNSPCDPGRILSVRGFFAPWPNPMWVNNKPLTYAVRGLFEPCGRRLFGRELLAPAAARGHVAEGHDDENQNDGDSHDFSPERGFLDT